MLNQFRFKRDDFRKIIIRYYLIIIEKKNVINALNEVEQIIEQTNKIIRNYQK